jgi:hypothetical protein
MTNVKNIELAPLAEAVRELLAAIAARNERPADEETRA